MSEQARARALEAWRLHDEARAVHAMDRRTIVQTDAARALILELAVRGDGSRRDLFTACAQLGRLFAESDASPTLAAATIDGLVAATDAELEVAAGTDLTALRASVVEGYLSARIEAEHRVLRHQWDYPACAVRVDAATVAIVAGHPTGDLDALGDWAARVALKASRDGVRRALVSGTAQAVNELRHALDLVGIRIGGAEARRSWLRLPFWKKAPEAR